MIARLLDRDRDFDPQRRSPWNAEALQQDLGMAAMLEAMAGGDRLVLEVARKVLLTGGENGAETIAYRQNVLRDCLRQPAAVRALYALAGEAEENEKKHYLGFPARHPDWVLRLAIEQSEAYLGSLRRLRQLADAPAGRWEAAGWTALWAGLRRELSDDFLGRMAIHLEQLKLRGGVRIGARLGEGSKGADYVLLRPAPEEKKGWRARLLGPRAPTSSFTLDPRDESGIRALEELKNRAIGAVAQAMARAVSHMQGFFHLLRTELAFYIGCLNLHEQLERQGEPVCFPEVGSEGQLSFAGLYDVGLALRLRQPMTGNRADADGRGLVIVTGANQGGKTTFLRSLGLAQIMMQGGMFAPAAAYRASLHDGVFTHYRREEDAGMKSGKLDEELQRMSAIVDHLTPHAMVLFNESFAATNEREGAEIARQVLTALLEKGVRIVFVTHLYELAEGFYRQPEGRVLFLRAERGDDGGRNFVLAEGRPLPTSYGEDVYRRVFGETDFPAVSEW